MFHNFLLILLLEQAVDEQTRTGLSALTGSLSTSLGQSNVGGPSITVNNLSDEPFIFVRIKPVDANLSLEQTRDKFVANLKKLRISSNYETESEAMREYIKLTNSSTSIVNPETERNRKSKLMNELKTTFSSEYNKIISDYQQQLDNYLSKENTAISISEDDFNISSFYISDFDEPKWGTSKQSSLSDYYTSQTNSLLERSNILYVDGVDPPANEDRGPLYMRYTRPLRNRNSPITYERYSRDNSSSRDIFEIVIIFLI